MSNIVSFIKIYSVSLLLILGVCINFSAAAEKLAALTSQEEALWREQGFSPMCRIFDISVSGYYSWRSRSLSNRALEDQRLEIEIQAAHKRTRKTCGSKRIQEDLAEHGIDIGVHRIRRIRKKLGIMC